MNSFCWMCQLLTFLQVSNRTADLYNIVSTDDAGGRAYLRFGRHGDLDDSRDHATSTAHAAREGICRALGGDVVPACADVGTAYVDTITFSYAYDGWMAGRAANLPALAEYVRRFRVAERESRPAAAAAQPAAPP